MEKNGRLAVAIFWGVYESGCAVPVPVADVHYGIFIRAFNEGSAENLRESAGENVLGGGRGMERISLPARHQQFIAVVCRPEHVLSAYKGKLEKGKMPVPVLNLENVR